MSTNVQAIVTVPPHARFLEEVAGHPLVAGLRLNTVMPIKGTHDEVLSRLAALGKPLYVDLKGRQLRVAQAAVPPFTEVTLTHRVKNLSTPALAYFSDGRECAEILEVDGHRLILADGPRRFVGPGESVNVPCPSLEVEGVLTQEDERYVRAAAKLGLHDFMLSFVESPEDVEAVTRIDPRARVVAKIESEKGLAFAREAYSRERSDRSVEHGGALGRLMAARGDLWIEVKRPHRIVRALRDVVAADPDAIVASRILPSLARSLEPECQDVSDVALLLALGYRTLMLGDEVCLRRDSVISALNLLEAIADDFPGGPR